MDITPLSDHLGAEVRGIDLSRPVADALRAQLKDAFALHGVLALSLIHI